jgi:hypothetical protein
MRLLESQIDSLIQQYGVMLVLLVVGGRSPPKQKQPSEVVGVPNVRGSGGLGEARRVAVLQAGHCPPDLRLCW